MRPKKSGTAAGLQWFGERCDIDSAADSHRTLEVMQASVASRKFHKVFIPRKQHCGEFLLNTGAEMAQRTGFTVVMQAFGNTAFCT